MLPRNGVAFIAGPPGSGKSFLAIDLVSKIARGEPAFGRRVLMAGTAYVAAEGANGVRGRFEAARRDGGPWDHQIWMIGNAPNLASDDDVGALKEKIQGLQKDMQECWGHRLGGVVIDTLSASMPGVDENSGQEMSAVMQRLQKMAVDLDVCVIVVAHVGKSAERGIRGWSGQHANADATILLDAPTEGGIRVGQVVKVKDGESGERFAFRLKVVELGIDTDGDPVTTCVVEHCDSVPQKSRPTAEKGPGAQPDMILSAYERLPDKMVVLPSIPGVRAGTKGIKLNDLRATTFDLGFHVETKPADDDEPALMRRWVRALPSKEYRCEMGG